MAFTMSESSVPLVGHYCLLCREVVKSSCQNTSAESAEVLQDIFQVFSKYMKWDPPAEYKYDFRKHQFPFCPVCNLILVRIYKIHEDIQSLEKQIDQFVLSATAKILNSEDKAVALSIKEFNQPFSKSSLLKVTEPGDTFRLDERDICFYYRETISKGYSVRVQLTSEDAKQLENYERAVKSKNDAVGDLDEDCGTHGDFVPSAESSESEDDPRDVSKVNKSRTGTTRNSTSSVRNSSDQGLSSDSDGFMHLRESSVSSENDPADIQETNKAIENRIGTAQHSTSGIDDSDEESSGDCDDGVGQGIPVARKRAFSGRIKEINPDEYLLDGKLSFVFHNPDWKCSLCNKTALERNIILCHITSTFCSGLVSPNSVKELQHRGYKYDKLDDGRFECRRCTFIATSNSSLKRHIVGSHWRATKQNRQKRKLVKKLIKSASITQPCPNVFLVNDKHKFRLKDSNFSCGACSFCTRSKAAVIRHIFEKHEDSAKSTRTTAMKIHRLGPNKYKLGDFLFEAFPGEYKCTTCGHACDSLLHMKQHIRYEHVKDMSKMVCDLCGYNTFCNKRFNRHLSSHKDDRPFLCPTCGKSFKLLSTLLDHEAKAHPKSPVVKSHLCEICGKKFRQKCNLSEHMKHHTYVNCEICGKTYSPLYLPKHLESHVDEKKYECKECGSKFQHLNSLSTHRKSCNGEKPYSCDICGMKFTQSFSVTRHKSVVHNPEKKTKTCVVKGPRKQRRGQSLLTNKQISSSAGKDRES